MDAAISGSQEWAEDATATSLDARPSNWPLRQGVPAGETPQPSRSPNVVDPIDNSQSQP
jgi:hypothetical protein